MRIDEIRHGTVVNLEMVKDEKVYEVATTAVGTHEDKILLRPFVYKGQVLDLGNKGFKGISFNIYCDDPEGNRVAWKSVRIRMVEYRGNHYYAVEATHFHALSVRAERRKQMRAPVNISGYLVCESAAVESIVNIRDISDTGIAVISKRRLPIRGIRCEVQFSDYVNGTDYELQVECRCVREEELPKGEYLYGCAISDASHEMLSYVYIQKILERSAKR
ncbi:MAG: PilZ domain-containing protein [Agathobacter sp.]|uniref:PilZ domain-containing protein n=1 Tax=Agathobacter sp. TaxID=2021311 RepID=UPI0004E1DFF5|nr:PilZ domain-containing protein [Agathobacter sp.]MBQ1681273.1 PilZ domain-containing protein [Agathobacter sp.]